MSSADSDDSEDGLSNKSTEYLLDEDEDIFAVIERQEQAASLAHRNAFVEDKHYPTQSLRCEPRVVFLRKQAENRDLLWLLKNTNAAVSSVAHPLRSALGPYGNTW